MKARFGGIGGPSLRFLCAAMLAFAGCLIGSPTAHAAPSWLAPINLSAPGKEASNSSVAMDEAGETVAVWERQSETGIDNDVQAATRSPGASFSEPIQLSSAATEPDVAITAAGEAVVVWRHFEVNTGDYEIQVSSRPPGGTFSAPVEVSQADTKAAVQGLRIAVNPSGAVALVWIQKEPSSAIDPEQFSVLASVRPSGGTFSTPTIVSPMPLTPGANASNPSIAIDAGGDVRAAWEYFDGTNYLIQTASRPAGGDFSSPQSITGEGEEAFGPELAVDSSGAATVVWDRFIEKETSYTVQAASAAPGGSFGAATDLSSVSTTISGEPVIATAPNGLATVAWTQSNGANNIIQAATGSAGGSFRAPIALSPSGQEALDPEVAIDPSGASTVVWKGSDGTNDIVEAANGSAVGSFSAAVDLSAAGQDAVFPRVAMDGGGDATAVWWRSDGANQIVQAAGYDADAPTLRSISLPSSGTVGVPVSFSVMPIDVWPISSTTFAFGDGAHAEGNAVSQYLFITG